MGADFGVVFTANATKRCSCSIIPEKNFSAFTTILLAFVFFFLPYKVHVAVWSSLTTGNVLFENSQFHLGLAAMAAMLFGLAGLCADPFFEWLSVGRAEYWRRYGPPKPGLNYPWNIGNIQMTMFIFAPLLTMLVIFYLFDGYEITDREIIFRQGPFSSFHRDNWGQVRSINAHCFRDRYGFVERFSIVTNSNEIGLGTVVFGTYSDEITPEARSIEHLMSVNNMYHVNTYISRGCNSPDIAEISRLADANLGR